MSRWELERKAVQFARQLDDVRERIPMITRKYDTLLEVRQRRVVATVWQFREPVRAVLDGLPKTARPRWIPVGALAVGVLLVPLALLRGRSRATELRETVTHDARNISGRAGIYASDTVAVLRKAAERQAASLADHAQAMTDTLATPFRRAMD